MSHNKFHWLLFLWLYIVAPLSSMGQGFDVMTFNIRLDAPADGINAWDNRKADVVNMLKYYSPDLLGMQEVRPNQLDELGKELSTYAWLGVGRDDGHHKGEHCPIFYKKERFQLLDSGNFSLSTTPEVFGVKGWDASYNRVATWAVLLDKQTGKKLAFVNTHLDNDGRVARAEGIKLVLRMMKRYASGLPLVITGDFNSTEQDVLNILQQDGMVNTRDKAKVVYGPNWSFHDFGRLPVAQRQLLDHVYVSPTFSVDRYRVMTDKPDEHYLSDHCPVLVRLILS
ncbi:MAG: endonuclease/exonuclease/phosphatase family protein [Prevotella sp.]|jgi:endonuclease/exonuclease/phosphatase family metal-dependent hydrolase